MTSYDPRPPSGADIEGNLRTRRVTTPMRGVGVARDDKALFELLCRLTASPLRPHVRRALDGRLSNLAPGSRVVHDVAMGAARAAWIALLRDLLARAKDDRDGSPDGLVVRLSSLDDLLTPGLLEATRPYELTPAQLRAVLRRVLISLVKQTPATAGVISLPWSLSLDRAMAVRLVRP
jgi:hypothetical protein